MFKTFKICGKWYRANLIRLVKKKKKCNTLQQKEFRIVSLKRDPDTVMWKKTIQKQSLAPKLAFYSDCWGQKCIICILVHIICKAAVRKLSSFKAVSFISATGIITPPFWYEFKQLC